MADRDALKLFFRRCLGTYSYLNQGVVWYPKPPAEPMRIDEMDAEWRYNCARMLLRNAAAYADRYSLGEIQTPALFGLSDDNADDLTADMERWDAERLADPQGWMRTTALYRALVAGLPSKPQKLYRLSQRARHWAACPARRSNAADCSCAPSVAQDARPTPVLLVGTGGHA